MADAVVVETKPVNSGDNVNLNRGLLLWIFAPIAYLFFMSETDPYLKFYGKQSLYYCIFALVVYLLVLPLLTLVGIGICLSPIVFVADIVLRVFMIVKMKNGEKVKLPVIGDMADKA